MTTMVLFSLRFQIWCFLGAVTLLAILLPVASFAIPKKGAHGSQNIIMRNNLQIDDSMNRFKFVHNSKMNSNDEDDEYEDEDEKEILDRSMGAVNVLGTPLIPCCTNVRNTGIGTGFYRNGYCSTGEDDLGRHTVCVQVTDDFLEFSKNAGNDLSTPFPEYLFPGLKHGDLWCLCAARWVEAFQAGKAPKLFLQSTHEKTLTYAPYELLYKYALDQEIADSLLENLNEQRSKLDKLLEK